LNPAFFRLDPTAQQELVTLMWQTIAQMEESLATVQEAYGRLHRTLREKRLLLTDKNHALQQALDQNAAQRETIATLRQDNARLTRELGMLHHQLTGQRAEVPRLQKEQATLVQQYDTLVGEHHRLFQQFHRAQRKGEVP
jgi:chromosome segregation ATPase